jgi:hypothetical protein
MTQQMVSDPAERAGMFPQGQHVISPNAFAQLYYSWGIVVQLMLQKPAGALSRY